MARNTLELSCCVAHVFDTCFGFVVEVFDDLVGDYAGEVVEVQSAALRPA